MINNYLVYLSGRTPSRDSGHRTPPHHTYIYIYIYINNVVVETLRGIRVIAPRHIIMVILFVDDVGRTFTILLKNSKPAAMFWVGVIAKPTRDHRDRDSRVAQHCRSRELLSLLAPSAGGVKGTP